MDIVNENKDISVLGKINEPKIMISYSVRGTIGLEPIVFANVDALVEYLENCGVMKITLEYTSMIDDSPTCLEILDIENLKNSHYEWLIEKVRGETRRLSFTSKSSKPYILKKNMMHPVLMPFKEKQVEKYFSSSSSRKHIEYFKKSIDKYKMFEDDKTNFPTANFKSHRQAEKDERFHTTRTFVNLFEREMKARNDILKSMLTKAFGSLPPFNRNNKYPDSWDDLLQKDLTLTLEHVIAAPKEYKDYLSKNLHKRHFVNYVLESGKSTDMSFRSDLEGPTHIDAFIHNADVYKNFKIYIEAKYLADISYDVSYDVMRNQIARIIDVMLEDVKAKSLFILITPEFFKHNPHSRLYGYKMQDYKSNHLTLMADLCHRKGIEPYEWKQITERIAWITWEDLRLLGI